MTSNAPDTMYTERIENYKTALKRFIGPTRTLVSGETLQVKDYSKFNWTMFYPQQRMERGERAFPEELKKAFSMGASILG